MSLYDLGTNMEDAKKEGSFEPMEAGVYDFQVADITEMTTKAGRPMLKVVLEIINHEKYSGRKVFHNCPMPWTNPATGSFDNGGIGLLTGLVQGVGQKWEGTSFDSDTLRGGSGQVELRQRPRVREEMNSEGQMVKKPTGDIDNEVKKFIF